MKLNEKITNIDYSNDHVVSDANNATETGGYYTISTTINLPMSGSAGYLNVMKRNDDNITQTWTRYRDNQVFMRQFNSVEPSGWKEWEIVAGKSAITVMCTTNKTYSQNNYLVVDAYNTIINKLGTNIEMTSNGQFKVNKDINLLFSFCNNVQPWVEDQLIMYKISINNEEPYTQMGFDCINVWGNSGQSLSNFVLKLKKNDTVALKLYASNGQASVRAGSFISLIEI